MCIEVFLACKVELPCYDGPYNERFHLKAFPERAEPLRAVLQLPFLYYVGAHTGCGCGFNSGDLSWQGVSDPKEANELLGAMSEDERKEFLSEQSSREQLTKLIRDVSQAGDVKVYCCWWGDEAILPEEIIEVSASYFAQTLEPMRERVLFEIKPS